MITAVPIARTWLVDGCASARVVLLHGPTGTGKSVTAGQIARARGGGVVRIRGVRAATTAVDALVAAAASSTAVILDDAHHIDDETADEVVAVIDRLPALPLVVIAGRRLGRFAVLGDRSDARVIGAPQLMFTRDEIAALAARDLPAALRDDLYTATSGWPVLVERAAERIAADARWVPSGPNGVTAIVRDLLEPLHESAPGLGVLARLPLIDEVIARTVTGSADVFHLVPLGRLGRWSTFPAFAEQALSRSDRIEPTVLRAVVERYLALGEVAAAAAVLCREATPEAAAELLAGVHWSTLRELDAWLLREVVDLVERATSEPHATVTVLLAASRAAEYADRELWGACLDRAEVLLARAGDAELTRAVAVDRARHTLRSGDIDGGASAAAAVLSTTARQEPATRGRALVVLAMADAFAATPSSFADAARRFREAAELFRQTAEWAWRADALARLGYHALYLGGFPQDGQAAMEEALALLPVADRVRALWLTHYSDVLDLLGRVVDADAVLREAIEIGERLHDDAVIGMAWWSRSWLASHQGDVAAFRTAAREVERHRGDWLQDGQELEFLASTAERFVMVGDSAGYHRMIERARPLAARIGRAEPIDLATTMFEVIEGDARRGRDELLRIEGTAAVVAIYRPRRLLQLAVAHARLGDTDAAREAARAAIAAAAELGVPDLHSRQNARLLELVAPLLDAEPDGRAATLTIRMLGGFSVVAADGATRTPQPGHASTLVKLIALNGIITTEAAIDWLWPEADAATGRSRLRNVLNRLKERSGTLIVRDGETLRLAPDVVVDVTEFEHAAGESAHAATEERIGRARRAVALYAGDLLPGDVYEDWSSGHRERLRRRFVGLADAVAADAEARGDVDEAARLLDLAVEIEPLDEVRTLRLCELLQISGRVMSAASVARRCIAVLAELGIEPGIDLARFAAVRA